VKSRGQPTNKPQAMPDDDSSFDEDNNNADSVHPFKLFESKERRDDDGGRLDPCAECVQLLSSQDRRESNTNSQKKLMSCIALGLVTTICVGKPQGTGWSILEV
jgi:hypothetical protein